MEKAAQTKLDRYAILKTLQDFEFFGTGKIEAPRFPNRRDGGRWLAHGIAFDAGIQKFFQNPVIVVFFLQNLLNLGYLLKGLLFCFLTLRCSRKRWQFFLVKKLI